MERRNLVEAVLSPWFVNVVPAPLLRVGTAKLWSFDLEAVVVKILLKCQWLFCEPHGEDDFVSLPFPRQANHPISFLSHASNTWLTASQRAISPKRVRGKAGVKGH